MNTLRHKRYQGVITNMDYETGTIHGEVILINDVVTFQGRNPKELFEEFKASVDDYLEWCEEEGQDPEKPLKGEFLVRCGSELQGEIQKFLTEMKNQGRDISRNEWCIEALKDKLNRDSEEMA